MLSILTYLPSIPDKIPAISDPRFQKMFSQDCVVKLWESFSSLLQLCPQNVLQTLEFLEPTNPVVVQVLYHFFKELRESQEHPHHLAELAQLLVRGLSVSQTSVLVLYLSSILNALPVVGSLFDFSKLIPRIVSLVQSENFAEEEVTFGPFTKKLGSGSYIKELCLKVLQQLIPYLPSFDQHRHEYILALRHSHGSEPSVFNQGILLTSELVESGLISLLHDGLRRCIR